jgi:hypothetical protein
MKNQSWRLIGLTIVLFALLLPLLSIVALNSLPLLTGNTTPKLLLAKRSESDKKLALIQNSKVELFDEEGCGDKQFPSTITRFFAEEKTIAPTDPILDYFKTPKKETNCQYETVPTLYIFDPSKKTFTEVTIDEANKLNFDTTPIDKIRGKVSAQKQSYSINYSKTSQYKIEKNQVTSYSKILGQEVTNINSLPTPGFESQQQFESYNSSVLETLGFIK